MMTVATAAAGRLAAAPVALALRGGCGALAALAAGPLSVRCRGVAGFVDDACTVAVPMPGVLLTNALYARCGDLSSALGTGRTDPELGQKAVSMATSLPEVAEQLRIGLLARHGAGARALLIGHSYGGYGALEFARRYPELVSGLVLVSTQARADTEHMVARRQAQIRLLRDRGLEALMETIQPLLVSSMAQGDPTVAESIRSMSRVVGAEVFERQVIACSTRVDQRETLRALPGHIPVLTIAGKEDKVTPPRVFREMQQLLSERSEAQKVAPWRSTLLTGAGHLAPLERPGAFRRALEEWREEVRQHHASAERAAPQRVAADPVWDAARILGSLVHRLGVRSVHNERAAAV